MRYILLIAGTQADWRALGARAPEDIGAYARWFRCELDRQLLQSGELVSGEGLTGPERAQVVHAQDSGPPRVTAAPFPEDREFLIGYWVVDCDGPGRALEIAARLSETPGSGGVPLYIPVEVRQLMRPLGEEM